MINETILKNLIGISIDCVYSTQGCQLHTAESANPIGREQTVLTDASTSYTTTRTYGNGYEKTVYTDGTPTTEINYIQCGGDLVGMYVNQPSGGDMYYVYSDHLGSILTVTDGTNTYNQSFDVWGNYRNPANGVVGGAMTGPVPPAWLYRGFTGHEHLPEFQLINANGRLYDPLVGSMLSPDITVQSPTNTQNFNRYSYCMNNPLKYSDPTGMMYVPCGMWLTGSAAGNSDWFDGEVNFWELELAAVSPNGGLSDDINESAPGGGSNDPAGGGDGGNTPPTANIMGSNGEPNNAGTFAAYGQAPTSDDTYTQVPFLPADDAAWSIVLPEVTIATNSLQTDDLITSVQNAWIGFWTGADNLFQGHGTGFIQGGNVIYTGNSYGNGAIGSMDGAKHLYGTMTITPWDLLGFLTALGPDFEATFQDKSEGVFENEYDLIDLNNTVNEMSNYTIDTFQYGTPGYNNAQNIGTYIYPADGDSNDANVKLTDTIYGTGGN